MAKVIFLFTSHGAASPGATKRVYPTTNCGDKYLDTANEGYFKMLDTLLKIGAIDDLKIFYESNVQPGIAHWVKGPSTYCEVIPEIRFVEEYIEPDTIIFARGGFKHWPELLMKYKGKNWLMLYAANTGRERWTWWDIILDDLKSQNTIDRYERYYFPFVKPINEEIFFPVDISVVENRKPPMLWDVCIGASHVHDRKGQWRVVNGILEYNKRYGEINAIMPGAPRRGTKTLKMIYEDIPKAKYVHPAGFVHRTELRRIFNDSKLFIHFGAHGQNDRGPIEAFACGTTVVIGSPSYHAPYFDNGGLDIDNPGFIAEYLKVSIDNWIPELRKAAYISYKRHNGFNEVVIPRMETLFRMLGDLKPSLKSKEQIMKAIHEAGVSNAGSKLHKVW